MKRFLAPWWLLWLGIPALAVGCGGAAPPTPPPTVARAAPATPTFPPLPTPTRPAPIEAPRVAAPAATPAEVFADLADVVARVKPAVVHIATETGVGSGIVYRPDGYILTNNHVVADARSIRVTLPDGRTLPGSVPTSLADFDLAMVKVEAAGLPYATFGDATQLREGEGVVAIGYALNFTNGGPTVTNGIVSAKRPATDGPTLIQTTVPLNPGNSGGPLVNRQGQVVGINRGRLRSLGQTAVEGVSFAVSANDAVDFISGRAGARVAQGGAMPAATPATSSSAPGGPQTSAQPPMATPTRSAGSAAPAPIAPPSGTAPTAPATAPAQSPTGPIPTIAQPVAIAIAGHEVIAPLRPAGPFTLVGEILNTGQQPIENPRVTITYLDAAGRSIGTDAAAADLSLLLPGERASFAADLTRAPGQWANLGVEVQAGAATAGTLARIYRDLAPEGVSFTLATGPEGSVASGQVRNTGASTSRTLRLSAIFYNAEGKIIDVATSYTDPIAIAPGQSAPFRLPLRRPSGYARYIITAEGSR